jgi:hypothetical protein
MVCVPVEVGVYTTRLPRMQAPSSLVSTSSAGPRLYVAGVSGHIGDAPGRRAAPMSHEEKGMETPMESYDETRLRAGVDAALKSVRTILDNTRNPQYAADVPHRYEDKYLLAEALTRTSTAAILQCLGGIGLSSEGLAQLMDWAETRSVTLRLRAQESCSFAREESREVESAQKLVVEKRSMWGGTEATTGKVVTTVKEFFWSFAFEYELIAFPGNDPGAGVSLQSRSGKFEIKTAAKSPPRLEQVLRPHLDANITWLLRQVDPEHRASFAIDRSARECHTPRRNPEVEAALRAHRELAAWCASVHGYFVGELFPAQQEHHRDLSAIHARDVFVPVLPLFEGAPRPSRDADALPAAYADAFLAEQRRSLSERCRQLAQVFPRDATAVTVVEAVLLVTLLHAADVCQRYADGVDYVEAMLREQLIAAIGKALTPADFSAYMDFHQRKLFKPEYRPRPFSHAVRRPDHSPEGAVSIEAERGAAADPISTVVAFAEAQGPMGFALDASTRVSFLGERYLHAWVSHQFSGQSGLSLSLVARARQFSSFVLMVGRIASADTFEPRSAIILQNKDLLKIPLMLEQIPTPKEFRDAIESLSPEQQRFAKAFRGMQLESTLFAVCVIQIKPQLEALLKLPADSLTKEIRMTQDLLGLFIEFQIPSDLVSYDGPAEAPAEAKLARVKEHIAKMQEMIDLSKRREIDEARERESLRLAEANLTPVAPPSMGSMPYGMPPGMPMPAGPPRGGATFGAVGGAPGPMPGAPMPMPAPQSAPMPAPRTSAVAPTPQAAPPPAVAPAQPASVAPRQPQGAAPSAPADASGDVVDYTRIPGELDRRFEALDEDDALRPTIINPGDAWSRTSQKGLLSAPTTAPLLAREQKTEKHKAFDLLDALSKSGALPIEHASLHVVIAATHCFDQTLLDTVIEDNVNPIEKVERSVMIVATTIHRQDAAELLAPDQRERFCTYAPGLGTAPPSLPPTNADGA